METAGREKMLFFKHFIIIQGKKKAREGQWT